MLRTIDTSHWKKDIVNTSVDIDAVYTKATEGNYYVDDSCDPIVQWAKGLGKKWGVYHFLTNCITDPETEANFFVDNCLGYVGKGMLILDNEHYVWSNGTVANNPYNVDAVHRWLQQVFARTGVKAPVYMSLSVIQGADWSPVINDGYGLICADYVDNNTPVPNWAMDQNRDPNPNWDGTVNDFMWQFTSTGRLDGYGGNLDCNYAYLDAKGWDAYAGVQSPPAAPAPPPPDPAPPVQPVPIPEPATPPPSPTPQAPADPSHPINDHVPTPEPLPGTQPSPTNWKAVIGAIVAAVAAAIAGVIAWLHS